MDYNITYRDKDGGIQAIVSYKKDEKWKQRSKQGFKKKGDAKNWANDMVDEIKKSLEADLSIEDKGITFKEFTEKYIKDMEKYKEKNTILAYQQSIGHFKDLNKLAMESILFMHIQDCVNKLVESGLKISVVKLHLGRIKTLFNRASKKPYKVIAKTPIDEDILLPRDKDEIKKVKALNKSELEELLSKLSPKKDYMIALIASRCGLRIGEIMGLTWDCIDEKNKLLHVKKQWKNIKEGGQGFGTVKGKNSNRKVPIPETTFKELKKYKASNPTDLNNRIFLDPSLRVVANRLNSKFRKLGYDISIHDLRHTYATMLIANGVDFKTAAKLLGHSVEMTMRVYSHVNQDMLDRATRTINSIF